MLEQSCEWWVYDNGDVLDLVPGRKPTWAGYAPDVQTALSAANRAGKASIEIQVLSKLTNAVSHLFVWLGPTPVQKNVSSGTERAVMRLAPNEGTRDGPLFEERSDKLSPAVIEAAQVAWEGDDWDDHDTLEYVIFALSVSHRSVRIPTPPGFVLFKTGSRRWFGGLHRPGGGHIRVSRGILRTGDGHDRWIIGSASPNHQPSSKSSHPIPSHPISSQRQFPDSSLTLAPPLPLF